MDKTEKEKKLLIALIWSANVLKQAAKLREKVNRTDVKEKLETKIKTSTETRWDSVLEELESIKKNFQSIEPAIRDTYQHLPPAQIDVKVNEFIGELTEDRLDAVIEVLGKLLQLFLIN